MFAGTLDALMVVSEAIKALPAIVQFTSEPTSKKKHHSHASEVYAAAAGCEALNLCASDGEFDLAAHR